jgi:hypothetical protein
LAIPHEILHKQGELSREDWETIKRHPDLAEWLLGNIDYLKPSLGIPCSHHKTGMERDTPATEGAGNPVHRKNLCRGG